MQFGENIIEYHVVIAFEAGEVSVIPQNPFNSRKPVVRCSVGKVENMSGSGGGDGAIDSAISTRRGVTVLERVSSIGAGVFLRWWVQQSK